MFHFFKTPKTLSSLVTIFGILVTLTFVFFCFLSLPDYFELASKNNFKIFCESLPTKAENVLPDSKTSLNINNVDSNNNFNLNTFQLYLSKANHYNNLQNLSFILEKAKLNINNANCEKDLVQAKKAYNEALKNYENCVIDYELSNRTLNLKQNYEKFKANFVSSQEAPKSLLYADLKNVSYEDYCFRLDYVIKRLKMFKDNGLIQHCSDHVYNNTLPLKNFTSSDLVSLYYEIQILNEELHVLYNYLKVTPNLALACLNKK